MKRRRQSHRKRNRQRLAAHASRLRCVQGAEPPPLVIDGADPSNYRLKKSRMKQRPALALQLLLWEMSESMGNHDSEVVDASSVD